MSCKAYTFDFLETVSRQLREELDSIEVTPLSIEALQELKYFQAACNAKQGVYVVYVEGLPVYLGKADNVVVRLAEHREKISGRIGLSLESVGYKALLLDKSMSTAANENILIEMFRKTHAGLWNGKGFGPKDPGKNRDTGKPNYFDRTYPINRDWVLDFSSIDEDQATVGQVLAEMKRQLPYLLRYELDAGCSSASIDMSSLPTTAKDALHEVVRVLGPGWQGVILAHGMILYRTNAHFPYGTVLLP